MFIFLLLIDNRQRYKIYIINSYVKGWYDVKDKRAYIYGDNVALRQLVLNSLRIIAWLCM